MKSVVVYCGSSSGNNKAFRDAAGVLAQALCQLGIGVVYGGARAGLMGFVADTVLENGGNVTGVLPRFLSKVELAHESLTQLILVDTMHERKSKMSELGDGFIALPGGFGTMEELFEVVTWGQLGLHQKPIGILNTKGFFDPLIGQFENMVEHGFLKKQNLGLIQISNDVDELLDTMSRYRHEPCPKWIDGSDET